MTCPTQTCQCCGDRLIHQTSKAAHESSSALGQHVHDNFPTTFFYADIDAAILKRATGLLRIIEHKNPGQSIRPSQRALLPLLSIAVQGLIEAGLVHPESGVFTMWASSPFHAAAVQRVRPGADATHWASIDGAAVLPGRLLNNFLTGELLTTDIEETA